MMFLCGCDVRVMWCMLVPLALCFARSARGPPIVSYLCPFVRFLCRYDILRLFGFVCSKSRQEFLQSYINFYVDLHINSYQ